MDFRMVDWKHVPRIHIGSTRLSSVIASATVPTVPTSAPAPDLGLGRSSTTPKCRIGSRVRDIGICERTPIVRWTCCGARVPDPLHHH
jgi:hypothetical protein